MVDTMTIILHRICNKDKVMPSTEAHLIVAKDLSMARECCYVFTLPVVFMHKSFKTLKIMK